MKTVLIVEDEPINVQVFSKILTKRGGMSVKHTEDVDEVIKIAQSGQADVILMDVSLANSSYQGQRVDGVKITQLLKADERTMKLPVILVTAHAREGDREYLLAESGADGYIPKPIIDPQDFINQILGMIRNF